MDNLEQLQKELSDLKAENDELKSEVERLKNGNGFDVKAYIERLQEQAQRDKAATQDLVSRFL